MKNTNLAIALLLLSVGLFYTFISPQYQDVQALQALAGQYSNVLDSVNSIIALRDQLEVNYQAFPKTELDRLNKALPDNVDTVRLALDLDGMASKYGVSLSNLSTETGNDSSDNVVLPEFAPAYSKATVNLGFVSKYPNFKSILTDMEKDLRILDVNALAFQINETGLYEYKISANTYWLK